MGNQNGDPKLVSIPAVVARLLNRVMALDRGMWMLVVVKNSTGGRGILGWSVVEMPLEPKDALPNVVNGKNPPPL